jgi:hypothetical protein
MQNNNESHSNTQDAQSNIQTIDSGWKNRLWGVMKAAEPDERSMSAAMQRTGKSKEHLLDCNKESERFARHRIETAIAISLHFGWQISGRSIAAIAGASRNTIKRHLDLFKEGINGIWDKAKRWKPRDWRNKLRWLGRCNDRLLQFEPYLQGLSDLSSGIGVSIRRERRTREFRKGKGGDLDLCTTPGSRPNGRGSRNSKMLPVLASLQVDQAVYMCLIQGTDCEAGGDVQAGSDRQGALFSLRSNSPDRESGLLVKAQTAIAAMKNALKAVRSKRSERRQAAKEQSDSAKRCPSFSSIDLETGEVLMQESERSVVWNPSPDSQKPPGNPFLKKRSENNIPEPAASPPTQFVPKPSRRIETPHHQYLQPDEVYVPCPEDVKMQIKELASKFTFDKERRESKNKRLQRANMTHLERLELSDGANEQWWKENKTMVQSVLLNRKPEDIV